jgi:hypothetical protein
MADSESTFFKRALRFTWSVLWPVGLLAAVLWGYERVATPRPDNSVEVIDGEVEPSVGATPTMDLAVETTVDGSVNDSRTWLAGHGSGVYVLRAIGSGQLHFYSASNSSPIDLTPIVREHYPERFNTLSVDNQLNRIYVGGIHTPEVGVFRILQNGRSLEHDRSVRLTPDARLSWRVERGPDGWLGAGFLGDALIYSLREDATGDLAVVRRLGQPVYPDIRAPLVAGLLSSSRVALSPRGDRFAQAFLLASRLHIHLSDGRVDRMIAGPAAVRVELRRMFDHRDRQEKAAVTGNTKYAYIDVAADSDRIVALFSGRGEKAFGVGEASVGNELHVFSWTGELLHVARLARDIRALAIEPDHGFVWASTNDGQIVRFQQF